MCKAQTLTDVDMQTKVEVRNDGVYVNILLRHWHVDKNRE